MSDSLLNESGISQKVSHPHVQRDSSHTALSRRMNRIRFSVDGANSFLHVSPLLNSMNLPQPGQSQHVMTSTAHQDSAIAAIAYCVLEKQADYQDYHGTFMYFVQDFQRNIQESACFITCFIMPAWPGYNRLHPFAG